MDVKQPCGTLASLMFVNLTLIRPAVTVLAR